jgi:anaerobic ribonucleoside-triphosphate reductase
MTDKEILEANESLRQPVECWTRVMGYFRPYSQFNNGKKSEFNERTWFTESNTCSCEMRKVG